MTVDLTVGQIDTLDFLWDTTGTALGLHTLHATIVSDRAETDLSDNELTAEAEVLAAPLTCPGQLVAEYFTNMALSGDPALVRCEDAPFAYNWGAGSPDASIPADLFSASWTGDFDFDAATYTFTARADDGVRVWVGDELIIDGWINQAPTTYTAEVELTAGSHNVVMEYFENGGGAGAELDWEID